MTQTRLNSLMTLHIEKDMTDKLSLIEVANEFVQGSNHCSNYFGKFIPSDINNF